MVSVFGLSLATYKWDNLLNGDFVTRDDPQSMEYGYVMIRMYMDCIDYINCIDCTIWTTTRTNTNRLTFKRSHFSSIFLLTWQPLHNSASKHPKQHEISWNPPCQNMAMGNHGKPTKNASVFSGKNMAILATTQLDPTPGIPPNPRWKVKCFGLLPRNLKRKILG